MSKGKHMLSDERKQILFERVRCRCVEGSTGCWEWQGPRDSKGYGMMWGGQRMCRTHRISYECAVGPIPAGLEIDHLCSNRRCANPAHLEAVTHRENLRRGNSGLAMVAFVKERARTKTHCRNGHELTSANTYLFRHANGMTYRACRSCKREGNAAYNRRRKAEKANAAQ